MIFVLKKKILIIELDIMYGMLLTGKPSKVHWNCGGGFATKR